MRKNRSGLTLLEVMIVMALIAVLIALLLPAINNLRQSAARMQIANNLKQVALAMHTYQDAYGRFPAGSSSSPNNSARTRSYSMTLLPYIDHAAASRFIHEDDYDNNDNNNNNNENNSPIGAGRSCAPFTAALDFTTGDFQRVQNFACNLRVFTDQGVNTPYNQDMDTFLFAPSMPGNVTIASFSDGLSNTIALATRYANFAVIGFNGNVSCSAYDGSIMSANGAYFGVNVMTGAANDSGTTNGWQLAHRSNRSTAPGRLAWPTPLTLADCRSHCATVVSAPSTRACRRIPGTSRCNLMTATRLAPTGDRQHQPKRKRRPMIGKRRIELIIGNGSLIIQVIVDCQLLECMHAYEPDNPGQGDRSDGDHRRHAFRCLSGQRLVR